MGGDRGAPFAPVLAHEPGVELFEAGRPQIGRPPLFQTAARTEKIAKTGQPGLIGRVRPGRFAAEGSEELRAQRVKLQSPISLYHTLKARREAAPKTSQSR